MLSNLPESALIGRPPNNQEDLTYIIAFSKLLGANKKPGFDPRDGLDIAPKSVPGSLQDDLGPGIIAGMSIAIAFVVIITGARLLVRAFHGSMRWGADDWVIIPAATGVCIWLSLTIVSVRTAGVGRHLATVTYEELYMYFRLGTIKQVIFYLTVSLVKISIALFNRRLTGLTTKVWMYLHNGYLAIMICYLITSTTIDVFQCSPIAMAFDFKIIATHDVKCLDTNKIGRALSIIHIITDFALLAVPLYVLYKLQMALSTKIRLMALFALGAISCVAALMRVLVLKNVSRDATWSYIPQMTWTALDITMGVIVASLPTLNKIFDLLRKSVSKIRSSVRSHRSKQSESSSVERQEKNQVSCDSPRKDEAELGISHIERLESTPQTPSNEKRCWKAIMSSKMGFKTSSPCQTQTQIGHDESIPKKKMVPRKESSWTDNLIASGLADSPTAAARVQSHQSASSLGSLTNGIAHLHGF